MAGTGAPTAAARLTEQVWAETNCYVDLWVGLLRARGLDPHPMLFPALAADFEGDQWTFVKPRHEDLRRLYGVEVDELQLWDGFERHVRVQLERGRIVLAEVDAYFLPDTDGVSYRREHVKTTIGIAGLDSDRRSIEYFHNLGRFTARGEDFEALIRPDHPLPLFAEIVKLERALERPVWAQRSIARELLARDVHRRPAENPIRSYVRSFGEHAQELAASDLETFHRYAFATLRQCGAAFDLAARALRWLDSDYGAAAHDFEEIGDAAKTALLKLARGVQRHRALDLEPLASVAERWDRAFSRIEAVH
jgi:hypothetical protein